MKQKNRLASRLYIIAMIAFYGYVLFAAHIIFCDLFITPTANFTTIPNHNYGYAVPVDIQLNQPGDTTMVYHNAERSKSGQMTTSKHFTNGDKKMFKDILNDSAYSKTLTVDSLTMRGRNKFINKEFDNISIMKSSGYAVLNPKDLGIKLFLAVRNYLFMFSLIYVLWLTLGFFKSLKNDFSFNRTVSRKLLIIGNVILCYQLINFVLCLIITQFYWHIRVESITSSQKTEMYSLIPSTEFNLGLVILSLALIVISRLLNYGHDLQEENELTI